MRFFLGSFCGCGSRGAGGGDNDASCSCASWRVLWVWGTVAVVALPLSSRLQGCGSCTWCAAGWASSPSSDCLLLGESCSAGVRSPEAASNELPARDSGEVMRRRSASSPARHAAAMAAWEAGTGGHDSEAGDWAARSDESLPLQSAA